MHIAYEVLDEGSEETLILPPTKRVGFNFSRRAANAGLFGECLIRKILVSHLLVQITMKSGCDDPY